MPLYHVVLITYTSRGEVIVIYTLRLKKKISDSVELPERLLLDSVLEYLDSLSSVTFIKHSAIAQTRTLSVKKAIEIHRFVVLIVDRRRIGRHKILKRFRSRRQTAGEFIAQQSPKLPSFTVQSSS